MEQYDTDKTPPRKMAQNTGNYLRGEWYVRRIEVWEKPTESLETRVNPPRCLHRMTHERRGAPLRHPIRDRYSNRRAAHEREVIIA